MLSTTCRWAALDRGRPWLGFLRTASSAAGGSVQYLGQSIFGVLRGVHWVPMSECDMDRTPKSNLRLALVFFIARDILARSMRAAP